MVAATFRPCDAQAFYDASHLLPAFDPDIALGASVVDVNADGRVDLYRRNRLYLQEADGRFTDVFEDLNFEPRPGGSFGAIFGDSDNDGFVETFFMDLDPNLPYYLSRKALRFEEHSNDSGIRDVDIVQGSVWTDFDRDGLLDLFVGIDGGVPRLYRNVGLDFFQNVAAASGFGFSLAYGVAVADYDGDGDPDIMLTQCSTPPGDTLRQNILFRNDDGAFENVGYELGIVDDRPSWGVVWLDYDNDGLLDFYVGNNGQGGGRPTTAENTLYRNLGDDGFQDVTEDAGVGRAAHSHSIAVAAADFDNDGWVDLFVCRRRPAPAGSLPKQRRRHVHRYLAATGAAHDLERRGSRRRRQRRRLDRHLPSLRRIRPVADESGWREPVPHDFASRHDFQSFRRRREHRSLRGGASPGTGDHRRRRNDLAEPQSIGPFRPR
ncbi:MAG TPA: VCBS repeat-containing protein [Rhodothermales bacterium]|nr:VCBS repeat-containing protein [Rhodothermales bacterium]